MAPSPDPEAYMCARVPQNFAAAMAMMDHKDTKAGPITTSQLLDWCRISVKPYNHITVDNFTTSFSDGLALCALITAYRPLLFNVATLDERHKTANIRKAFAIAKASLELEPPALDLDDLAGIAENDNVMKKVIVNYVASLKKRLESKACAEAAKCVIC